MLSFVPVDQMSELPKQDKPRSRQISDELLVSGYARSETESIEQGIPEALIQLLLVFYFEKYRILKFSTKWKSETGWKLSDDNKCVQRVPSSVVKDGYRHILVDTEPVFNGEQCWRVKVNNPKCGWIVWGICQNAKEYETGKFVHQSDGGGGYGVTYYDQYYPDDSHCGDRGVSCTHFKMANCEVDIYLNADKGTFKLCVVDHLESGEPKMKNLPINTSNGWVPYFVFGETPMGASLRIAKIPNEWYGVHEDGVFV